ncbi:MAG: transketolase [Firmicutes bacterium]|nr:transketolase [Bacillota bacterium]
MVLDPELKKQLEEKARLIRQHIIRMINAAQSGHPGGSLSAVEILTALYFQIMRLDPAKPRWAERDRFVLSKGHAAPALYAALAERGFFPADKLLTLRQLGSPLQGHPDMKKVPGIEMSTGSLGQGLSCACGMALAGKLDEASWRVYALLGDGECQEGQIWEAAMAAAHYELDNLIVYLDYNRLQIDGPISTVLNPEPFPDKWRAFGWQVQTVDGHSLTEIVAATEKAQASTAKPNIIICHTVKGKGVSFMENEAGWHGKAPSDEQAVQALAELA